MVCKFPHWVRNSTKHTVSSRKELILADQVLPKVFLGFAGKRLKLPCHCLLPMLVPGRASLPAVWTLLLKCEMCQILKLSVSFLCPGEIIIDMV